MAEDFANPFRYGLNNLPDEPPDHFGYPDYAYSRGWGGMPSPPSLPYSYGHAGQWDPPSTEWQTLMGAQPKGRRFANRRRKGNTETCDELRRAEESECHRRSREEEYAHHDHYSGCLDRAKQRSLDCRRNGGRPSELPVWGPVDEEIWINPDR